MQIWNAIVNISIHESTEKSFLFSLICFFENDEREPEIGGICIEGEKKQRSFRVYLFDLRTKEIAKDVPIGIYNRRYMDPKNTKNVKKIKAGKFLYGKFEGYLHKFRLRFEEA